jgi:hypothetical protein
MKAKCLPISILFLIVVILPGPSYAEIDPGAVVALWLLDEGQGNEVMDSSGNGHTGVPTHEPLEWVDGKFGNALKFKRGNPFIRIEHEDSLNLETFTLMLWVNLDNIGDWITILQKQQDVDSPATSNYNIGASPIRDAHTGVASGGFSGGEGQVSGSTTILDNSWHHIAVTYDLVELKLYIDGHLDGTQGSSAKPATNTGPLIIGSSAYGMQFGLSILGMLDEIAFFNVALEEEDIQAIINKGLRKALAVSSAGKIAITWGGIKGK